MEFFNAKKIKDKIHSRVRSAWNFSARAIPFVCFNGYVYICLQFIYSHILLLVLFFGCCVVDFHSVGFGYSHICDDVSLPSHFFSSSAMLRLFIVFRLNPPAFYCSFICSSRTICVCVSAATFFVLLVWFAFVRCTVAVNLFVLYAAHGGYCFLFGGLLYSVH